MIIILIESFSPSPIFFENAIVNSSEKIQDGPLYKKEYLPNLHELSQQSINFASMSSNGLPTIFGWFSFMTGEMPYMHSHNMIKSIYNDVDDFPSWFKKQGYHSLYITPSMLGYDGKHNWIFRGNPVTKKVPASV